MILKLTCRNSPVAISPAPVRLATGTWLHGLASRSVRPERASKRSPTRPSHPIRLLGPFDPVLHGWASRDWLIPNAQERGVVTTKGLFRPSILVCDRIVGTWAIGKGKIELKPFGRLAAPVVKELQAEEERVREYLER